MTPLDLTAGPPRPPRAELDGVVFLPRTIDKVRASLPGGKLGEYTIPGFTQMMLDTLGIPAETLTAAVATASTDEEAWANVRPLTTPEKIAEWTAFVSKRQPRGGNRVEALESYPWLGSRPDLTLSLDVLDEDDRQHFAGRS